MQQFWQRLVWIFGVVLLLLLTPCFPCSSKAQLELQREDEEFREMLQRLEAFYKMLEDWQMPLRGSFQKTNGESEEGLGVGIEQKTELVRILAEIGGYMETVGVLKEQRLVGTVRDYLEVHSGHESASQGEKKQLRVVNNPMCRQGQPSDQEEEQNLLVLDFDGRSLGEVSVEEFLEKWEAEVMEEQRRHLEPVAKRMKGGRVLDHSQNREFDRKTHFQNVLEEVTKSIYVFFGKKIPEKQQGGSQGGFTRTSSARRRAATARQTLERSNKK